MYTEFPGTYSAIAVGSMGGVGVRTDGTLAWFIDNAYADGPAGTYTDVAAGSFHFLAIRTDGALVSWDFFGSGLEVPAGTFVKVAARGDYSLAISTSASQTPSEQIEALQAQVRELMRTQAISLGNGKALLAKLDAAFAALARGDVPAAVGAMTAFVNQVDAFVGTGAIAPSEGQGLKSAAQDILLDLGI
jgi:hypothetical protein